jgi:hypothetical protein
MVDSKAYDMLVARKFDGLFTSHIITAFFAANNISEGVVEDETHEATCVPEHFYFSDGALEIF